MAKYSGFNKSMTVRVAGFLEKKDQSTNRGEYWVKYPRNRTLRREAEEEAFGNSWGPATIGLFQQY